MTVTTQQALASTETYQQMAQAIAFMRQHQRNQPDLAAIAAHVHLSPSHLQKCFTQWAGISPKRFGQYLTLEYAKTRIQETQNLLALTQEAGLSSPGRLHDLFVNLVAMSPGEYKQGGKHLRIHYGSHDTPFGSCLIATTERGICNLQFLDMPEAATHSEIVRTQLAQAWPQAELILAPQMTQAVSNRLFAPFDNPSPSRALSLHVKGTNFQIQVWRALLQIPPGGITTYQDLAQRLGRPTAARAVGNAVGQNPLAYLIPCHRVLRSSGELGGYRWGLTRKAALVGWEAGQTENDPDSL
ncbi:MAG: methylated-DNA--[protein]-cysteine S-methyltransferase [Cyanobacteria bacterium P01_G01_bin.54]